MNAQLEPTMTPWNPQTKFDDQSSALLVERRDSERTAPCQVGTHIWLQGNRRVEAEVIDESPSGIGVVIPNMSFTFGPIIELDYDGQRRTARVAYLEKADDGKYRLGLEWVQLREV